MKISLLDLTEQYKQLEQEILPAVTEVLASGRYIMGENVRRFEEEAARYLGQNMLLPLPTAPMPVLNLARPRHWSRRRGSHYSLYLFCQCRNYILRRQAGFVDLRPDTMNIDEAG